MKVLNLVLKCKVARTDLENKQYLEYVQRML